MKVKDITEIGFYTTGDADILLEVLENTDESMLEESPKDKLIIDEWDFDHEEDGKRIYQTTGSLFSLYSDFAEVDVEKSDKQYEVFGNMGAFLKEIK